MASGNTQEYDIVDVGHWKRKALFRFYETFDNPTWDLLADVRITRFYHAVKETGHPFFLSFLYTATRACHEVEELRLRIAENGEVRRYHMVHPGSTVLREDGTFGFAYFAYTPIFSDYIREARQILEITKAQDAFEPRDEDLARIYFSPIPWVSFRGFRHPFRQGPKNSIPMIVFGKHEVRDGERTIPVGITLHHGLADGFHAGQFFARLQVMMDDPGQFLNS